jgi:hypothetical protein
MRKPKSEPEPDLSIPELTSAIGTSFRSLLSQMKVSVPVASAVAVAIMLGSSTVTIGGFEAPLTHAALLAVVLLTGVYIGCYKAALMLRLCFEVLEVKQKEQGKAQAVAIRSETSSLNPFSSTQLTEHQRVSSFDYVGAVLMHLPVAVFVVTSYWVAIDRSEKFSRSLPAYERLKAVEADWSKRDLKTFSLSQKRVPEPASPESAYTRKTLGEILLSQKTELRQASAESTRSGKRQTLLDLTNTSVVRDNSGRIFLVPLERRTPAEIRFDSAMGAHWWEANAAFIKELDYALTDLRIWIGYVVVTVIFAGLYFGFLVNITGVAEIVNRRDIHKRVAVLWGSFLLLVVPGWLLQFLPAIQIVKLFIKSL